MSGTARPACTGAAGTPPAPHEVEVLEQQLALLFRRARAGFESLAREVHPGLEAGAYVLLHLIDSGTAVTVTGLADRLSVGKPTVSRQVSALVRLGLLVRQPAADDGRAVTLGLTAEGTARLGLARDRRQEQFRSMLGQWDRADVAALAGLLERFNELSW